MPEEQNGQNGNGSSGAQTPNSSTGNETRTGSEGNNSSSDGGKPQTDLQAKLRQANQEAKSHREAAEAAQQRLQDFENQNRSLQQTLSQLSQEVTSFRLRDAIATAAAPFKPIYPDKLVSFVDPAKFLGQDGKIDSVKLDAHMKEIVQTYPAFFGSAGNAGDAGAQGKPSGNGVNMNDIIRGSRKR